MMLSSLIAPFLFLVGAIAAPTGEADNCPTLPIWTVTDFKSVVNDTVGSGGKASFKLANDLSGTSDELSCNLQVNYRCIITGTPSDTNLTVYVGVRAGSLALVLDKVFECPGRTAPLHVIGNRDIDLNCMWTEHGGVVTCLLDAEKSTITSEEVELAPGR
ncbi:hypothetical protein B0H67DRAFT_659804 [Lasiosphaeris hirsuta]|uniref:Uncharacterized protein n=1 Tax=Lasiosphaeris hirsuta TaxID=260670 RepID=A0AA40B1J2_9PEZI|nr:hypothetical protein B0H67DRAFT_659804 [Lasiosphaeris hirsuta]